MLYSLNLGWDYLYLGPSLFFHGGKFTSTLIADRLTFIKFILYNLCL